MVLSARNPISIHGRLEPFYHEKCRSEVSLIGVPSPEFPERNHQNQMRGLATCRRALSSQRAHGAADAPQTRFAWCLKSRMTPTFSIEAQEIPLVCRSTKNSYGRIVLKTLVLRAESVVAQDWGRASAVSPRCRTTRVSSIDCA